MSKAIKWQIPFVSTIDKIRYRIDIYAEDYSDDPIQLTGGTTPIKTEEDRSDDFFAPVRGQTGTIEVVTKLPNGGTLNINDLLPSNNIDHPVRLVSISGSTETIEWQGFMSCEAYSQNYTSIPETFSFPILSVLEAMDSVQLNPAGLTGLLRIDYCLQTILLEIYVQSGIQCFTHVNYSRTDFNILQKYIDMTVMFEQKEYNNENSTTYIVSGLSAKSALSRLCTYMGWVARENKTEISLQRIGEKRGAYRAPIDNLNMTETKYLTTRDIATEFADKWRGTDHKRSISQGAKSVEVVAKLEKYGLNMGLPPFPYTETTTYSVSMREATVSSYGNNVTIGSIVSSYITFSNIYEFKSLQLSNDKTTGTSTSISNVLSEAIINPSSSAYWSNNYVGAFMARIKKDSGEYQNGLFISTIGDDGFQYIPSTSNYVFLFRSLMQHTFNSGKLRIKMEGLSFYGGDTGRCVVDGCSHYIKLCAIKFGNKYWNGQSWQTSFTTIGYNPLSDDDGYYIPITTSMTGEIVVMLYPNRYDHIIPADYEQGYALGSFLSVLDITYEQDKNDIYTDRGENHYFRLLGTNFSDDISINTDLASSLNNQPSPSLIMNDDTNPMTTLDYFVGTGTVSLRPEVDLLDRLAQYYSTARQRLELIVMHPTAAPLPLLRLNGISPDTRQYTPLAESRDWINDTSTLTCFETPNNE